MFGTYLFLLYIVQNIYDKIQLKALYKAKFDTEHCLKGDIRMPRLKDNEKSITTIYTKEEYEQIQALASMQHTSMNQIVRNFVLKGLQGEVTENNIEFLAPIIREVLKGVLEPEMERLISLTAKTCIQAGAAAYLSADAILKFVPEDQREEVENSYHKARKKAAEYTRLKSE